MQPLKATMQAMVTAELQMREGVPGAIGRYRQWAEVLRARGERAPGFRDVIRARLVRELRRYYPHGSIGESLLDALLLLLMRCALDGAALDTTLLDEGPSGLEESPEPCVSDERGRVVVQVIEALAPHLMELYHAAVRDHWLAPLEGVAQGLVLLARIKAAVDGWASGLDDLLTPGGASNPHAALEELDAAQAELLMSLTLDALLTPQEAAVFGQILGNNLPYWLRLAADDDKAQLEALATRVLELEDAVALATDGLESLPRFVEVEVAEHVRHAHGVLMDPTKVLVASAYATEQGEQVRTSTLIELLLAGPYRPEPDVRRQVEQVPDGAKAGAIEWLDLLETFDARARYVEALGTFYHGQEGRSLLYDCLDAALVHSAFAARLQGHLGADNHDAIMATRDLQTPAASPSVASLALPGIGALTLLLFHNPDAGAVKPYILYAPGKYDGQEWVELPNLRALAQEIGGWVKDERGRLYLLEQLPQARRQRAEQYLEAVFLLPGQWPADADYRSGYNHYQAAVENLAARQVANRLETVAQTVAPRWYVEQPLVVRQQVNGYNGWLNVKRDAIERARLNPEPFVVFAKRTLSAIIGPYLVERGVTEPVDPDTIVFEFRPGAVFDFSFSDPPDKQTATLMDLAVTGYDDNAGLDNPRMPVRSSIGQDLTQLQAADLAYYIRRAYLGDKYARMVRAQFLQGSPGFETRGRVFAELTALTLRRDALVAKLKGDLDEQQYSQVSAAIDGVEQPGGAGPAVFFQATVQGQPLSQVYVLRLPGGNLDDALLYTPQAPDGMAFRPYQGTFGKGLPVALQLYFLQRVRLAAHESIREHLEAIGLGRAFADSPDTGQQVASLQDEYRVLIEGMLADVDRLTKSRREVITEQVLKGVGFASVPLGVIFPPLGFVLDLALVAVDAGRGYQAYRDGDVAAAVGFFTNAYISGLCLLLPVAYHHIKAVRQPQKLVARSFGIYRNASTRRPIAPGRKLRAPGHRLDTRQALHQPPARLEQVHQEGLTQGLYCQPASVVQPQPRYFIRQGTRYFEVSVDQSAGTLRLVDARYPMAHYKMPVHRTPQGEWTFNPLAGLRGGKAPLNLGAVNDLAQLFPPGVAPKHSRAALAGEAVSAGYNPAKADNYLMGVEVQGSVVTTLYNPNTGRGAVLNIDHGIGRPVRNSISEAVESLGPIDPAQPVQGAMVGGDWLAVPGDIFKQVNHALGLNAVLTRPDHWLAGNGLGGATGVLLDLKTGALLVWRFTSQGRKWFYDPLREYPAFGDEHLRTRAKRFWARMKGGRWQAGESGDYHNRVVVHEGKAGQEAVAIPVHVLD